MIILTSLNFSCSPKIIPTSNLDWQRKIFKVILRTKNKDFYQKAKIMSKRYFVDEAMTEEGKYRVLQEDTESKEQFGVKDFDTQEEAQNNADMMQKAADNAFSDEDTLRNIDLEDETDFGDDSEFKDTLQDLKDESSQE